MREDKSPLDSKAKIKIVIKLMLSQKEADVEDTERDSDINRD